MYLLVRLFVLLSLFGSLRAEARNLAENGILDLRGTKLDRPLELSGDWAFYWQSFVEPQDIEKLAAQRTLITVPSVWTNVKEKYPTFGYASYHLSSMAWTWCVMEHWARPLTHPRVIRARSFMRSPQRPQNSM